MAKNSVPIISINSYVDDFGDSMPEGLVDSITKKPQWMNDAAFNTILEAFGFRRKLDTDTSPCAEGQDFIPRKLTFITDKGSFSLPMLTVTNVADQVANVGVVRGSINGAGQKLLCVKKEGEKRRDVYSSFRTATIPVTPGTRAYSSGPGSRFSGKYQYRDDTDVIRIVAFGIDTESPGSPPSILEGAWASCAGGRLPSLQCSASARIKPRHFNLVTVYGAGAVEGEQSHKVPHASSTVGTAVKTCGQTLANLAPSICMDYRGESDNAYHRTIGAEIG